MTPAEYNDALSNWKEIVQLEQILEYKALELNTMNSRAKNTQKEIERLIAEMNTMRAEIEERTKHL